MRCSGARVPSGERRIQTEWQRGGKNIVIGSLVQGHGVWHCHIKRALGGNLPPRPPSDVALFARQNNMRAWNTKKKKGWAQQTGTTLKQSQTLLLQT